MMIFKNILVLSFYFLFLNSNQKINEPSVNYISAQVKQEQSASPLNKIQRRAASIKNYIKKNGFNTQYCFLINMAVPSGQKRFYIYNLEKDSIENSGLVTHGSGSENNNGDLIFKNIINSLATAKGKYKIGKSYYGQFGLAYKLDGLDTTNNKAMERFIVLHSHSCVPDVAVYPLPICLSWGCPTVSPAFLKILQSKIDKSSKPVLLDLQYIP